MRNEDARWPALPLPAWKDTYRTLHRYTQIAGKVRLAASPMMNEWWQVPLYLTARGLTTSPIPGGKGSFELDFDFFDHRLFIRTSAGETCAVELGLAVRDFYRALMKELQALGIDVSIRPVPDEVPDPVPFEEDSSRAYDPIWAARFFQVLVQVDAVFKEFRARFRGKCSPVHFFWGSFDLAVTRFSGRPAQPPAGADRITRLGYDAELISLGFWPGGSGVDGAAFYSYVFPKPVGLEAAPVRPDGAFFHEKLGEFLFLYDDARRASDPAQAILEFAQSVYEAGVRLACWPDAERSPRRGE